MGVCRDVGGTTVGEELAAAALARPRNPASDPAPAAADAAAAAAVGAS